MQAVNPELAYTAALPANVSQQYQWLGAGVPQQNAYPPMAQFLPYGMGSAYAPAAGPTGGTSAQPSGCGAFQTALTPVAGPYPNFCQYGPFGPIPATMGGQGQVAPESYFSVPYGEPTPGYNQTYPDAAGYLGYYGTPPTGHQGITSHPSNGAPTSTVMPQQGAATPMLPVGFSYQVPTDPQMIYRQMAMIAQMMQCTDASVNLGAMGGQPSAAPPGTAPPPRSAAAATVPPPMPTAPYAMPRGFPFPAMAPAPPAATLPGAGPNPFSPAQQGHQQSAAVEANSAAAMAMTMPAYPLPVLPIPNATGTAGEVLPALPPVPGATPMSGLLPPGVMPGGVVPSLIPPPTMAGAAPILPGVAPGITTSVPRVGAPAKSALGQHSEEVVELELKRARRKQSNRESARRSRMRKQSESEEMNKTVQSLADANQVLRKQLDELNSKGDQLALQNSALQDCLSLIRSRNGAPLKAEEVAAVFSRCPTSTQSLGEPTLKASSSAAAQAAFSAADIICRQKAAAAVEAINAARASGGAGAGAVHDQPAVNDGHQQGCKSTGSGTGKAQPPGAIRQKRTSTGGDNAAGGHWYAPAVGVMDCTRATSAGATPVVTDVSNGAGISAQLAPQPVQQLQSSAPGCVGPHPAANRAHSIQLSQDSKGAATSPQSYNPSHHCIDSAQLGADGRTAEGQGDTETTVGSDSILSPENSCSGTSGMHSSEAGSLLDEAHTSEQQSPSQDLAVQAVVTDPRLGQQPAASQGPTSALQASAFALGACSRGEAAASNYCAHAGASRAVAPAGGAQPGKACACKDEPGMAMVTHMSCESDATAQAGQGDRISHLNCYVPDNKMGLNGLTAWKQGGWDMDRMFGIPNANGNIGVPAASVPAGITAESEMQVVPGTNRISEQGEAVGLQQAGRSMYM